MTFTQPKAWWFSLLAMSAAAALFLLSYPLTVIQPFKPQDPVQLQRALSVFRVAPRATLALAVLAFLAVFFLWSKVGVVARIAGVILLLLTCVAAALSRVNLFEQLFHPAGAPKFITIQETKTDPDDMLIAASLNGQAHSYPIREIAYHHVVNDWVGGVPIVATY